MTPEQQRIAIAEACGWTEISMRCMWGLPPTAIDYGTEECLKHFPDYLNDLNAMHEAEKMLDFNQLRDMEDNVSFRFAVLPFHSTASQRAEAFLRTLDKWEETP